MTIPNASASRRDKTPYARHLDAVAWSLLLIWIGFTALADVGWGWALLGTSGITLGAQLTLWRRGETIDAFPVACGVVFLVGGVWALLGLTWPLAPVLLVLLGAAMLWNAMFGTQAQ